MWQWNTAHCHTASGYTCPVFRCFSWMKWCSNTLGSLLSSWTAFPRVHEQWQGSTGNGILKGERQVYETQCPGPQLGFTILHSLTTLPHSSRMEHLSCCFGPQRYFGAWLLDNALIIQSHNCPPDSLDDTLLYRWQKVEDAICLQVLQWSLLYLWLSAKGPERQNFRIMPVWSIARICSGCLNFGDIKQTFMDSSPAVWVFVCWLHNGLQRQTQNLAAFIADTLIRGSWHKQIYSCMGCYVWLWTCTAPPSLAKHILRQISDLRWFQGSCFLQKT